MRVLFALSIAVLSAACAGRTTGGTATGAPSSTGKVVAYQAKSGDVDPSGTYRLRLTGRSGEREADLWVWLDPDGTGYRATMQFVGQGDLDSLSVRVDGKRVRLEVRANDAWARRNARMSPGLTASGRGAPYVTLTPPIFDLLFSGTDFTGTRLGSDYGEAISGRRVPDRTPNSSHAATAIGMPTPAVPRSAPRGPARSR